MSTTKARQQWQSIAPINTNRLDIRTFRPDDAAFILSLLRQPSFLQYIGERGVSDLASAADYIEQRLHVSYQQHGFGLLAVCDRQGQCMGMCGLVRREGLPEPDLGYAFLPQFWHQGYAVEAGQAVLDDACQRLGLQSVLAVTALDNQASIAVLQRLGFVAAGEVTLAPATSPSRLFRWRA
ncbi:GNAT family N-acetyltransferase [Idiomarina xiamenensis]|uniref:Acetyltransferase n=1 Tax=Idiomarina xiamenensis 10-D-4 TaxID=740709 RepID=K2JMI4_9GAMM|nr:GNAT family N-acetyltransferase [Idiomarina xiamenensis]EKE84716.1 acetyltransferase [Idiomarina xiamenensis 10-D-4]